MTRKTLGISWLNGALKAAVLQGHEVLASWTAATPVPGLAELGPALAQAVKETGFSGRRVVFVLDNRNVVYHLQDTPPAKGAVVVKLLERLARQTHCFDEEAVWGHSPLPPGKGTNRFLLTLLPQSVLHGLRAACTAQRLDLAGVFAPTTVLQAHLRKLPVQPSEPLLLAADLGGMLCLVAGRSDGQLLFSRSVVLGATQDPARVGQEINRTLLFTQQQFGAAINQCWLYGTELCAQANALPVREGLSLRQSPVPEDPVHFACEAAALSPRLEANIASRSPSGLERVRRLAALSAAALLVGSVVLAGLIEHGIRVQAREAFAWQQNQAVLEGRQHRLFERQRQAQEQQAFLLTADPAQNPPVPDLFLHCVDAVLPTNVTLAALQVRQTERGWRWRLEGHAPQAGLALPPVIRALEIRITNGVLPLTVTDSTARRALSPAAAFPGMESSPALCDTNGFFVEGSIP